jgi:hypothetical protein
MINRYLVVADDLMVCVVFLKMQCLLYTQELSFFRKKNIIIGLYVENLPQRGSSSCSKRNSSANPDLSCYRRVICSFIVYHFDVPKVQFFIKNNAFNFVFANI